MCSQLSDLESIVMMELIQYLPAEDQRKKKTKNEPPGRNRSKQFRTRTVTTLTVARRRHWPMKKVPLTRSNIHRTMKRGQNPSLRRTRECPGDAASAVLSSSKRGSLNIKVWCPIGRIA
jgi:hypothetical protein